MCSLLPSEEDSRLAPYSASIVEEPIETLEGEETMAGVEGDLGLGEVHADEEGLLDVSA